VKYHRPHRKKLVLFQGEMMICKNCGRMQKSDPAVSSQWTAVVVDGKVIYFCPACFGNAKYLDQEGIPW
jgi:hypothetical protein